MMVWSLFIIGLMGLFFYNKIDSIIPMVVLPTTEIIEPVKKVLEMIPKLFFYSLKLVVSKMISIPNFFILF